MTEEATQEAPALGENELAPNEVENSLEATTEQESENAEGEAAPTDTKGEQQDVKPDDGVQRRTDQITRKRREAERRADRAEKRLQEMESANVDDMSFEDEIAHKAVNASRREAIDSDREAAQDLAREAYHARVDVVASKYTDYAQVTSNPSLQITPAMAEAIMDSDYGPDVAYHLGKNPQEAERIARLNPPSQARELGKLEALISTPKPASKLAPKPVNPVGAKGASGEQNPAKMTMAQYAAWRKANP